MCCFPPHRYNTRLNAKRRAEWPTNDEQSAARNAAQMAFYRSSYAEFPRIPNEHWVLTSCRYEGFHQAMRRIKQEELLQRPLVKHMYDILVNNMNYVNHADAGYTFTTEFVFNRYVHLNLVLDRGAETLTEEQWNKLSYFRNKIEQSILDKCLNHCLLDVYLELLEQIGHQELEWMLAPGCPCE